MTNKIKNKDRSIAIGMMSGTSLDGLDIAAVEFYLNNNNWSFQLLESTTIPYSLKWEERLKHSHELNGEQIIQLDSEYGELLGEAAQNFIQHKKIAPDLIASHGHTVFHRPEQGYTLQIGNGYRIANNTNTITVADFRTGDVALGGQGAPLVPIGDQLLFSSYEYCLNLGGFANISCEKNGERIAFDICPANFILNYYANKVGLQYDKNGDLGRKGSINNNLLHKLNNLSYYQTDPPKSLGREWAEEILLPLLIACKIPDQDKIRTLYEHIAIQITNNLSGNGKMIITGGGAFNNFLIERIIKHTNTAVVLPPDTIINFKEAIIFAFLGVLRIKGINNCLASVTGAQKDNCGGIVFLP